MITRSYSPMTDAYAEARLAFVDCPDVRIRCHEHADLRLIKVECSITIADVVHHASYQMSYMAIESRSWECRAAAQDMRRRWPYRLGEDLLTGKHKLDGPSVRRIAPLPEMFLERSYLR